MVQGRVKTEETFCALPLSDFYSLDRFKGKKDLDGCDPSIFIICNNRSAGKTTAVTKMFYERVLDSEKEEKFCLIYRHKYELEGAHHALDEAVRIVSEERNLKYPALSTKKCVQGLFVEILQDADVIGYGVCLTKVDYLRKYSQTFSKVVHAFFDEFQLETGEYLKNEVSLLQSLLISISRGGGERSRDVKLYMAGNPVSMLNPYYVHFGIYKRLKKDTKFMRGNGWIGDFEKNIEAAQEITSNNIFKSFKKSNYLSYATGDTMLINDGALVGKPTGKSRYICTIIFDGKSFGLYEYYNDGIVYLSTKFDKTSKNIVAYKAADASQNTMMLGRNHGAMKLLRWAYECGCLIFEDLTCQECAFTLLAVSLYK